jgi:hypothetical protein
MATGGPSVTRLEALSGWERLDHPLPSRGFFSNGFLCYRGSGPRACLMRLVYLETVQIDYETKPDVHGRNYGHGHH